MLLIQIRHLDFFRNTSSGGTYIILLGDIRKYRRGNLKDLFNGIKTLNIGYSSFTYNTYI